jgi:hypothetical protein
MRPTRTSGSKKGSLIDVAMGRDVHELAAADVITDDFVIGVGKDLGGRDESVERMRHRLR